MNDGAYVFVINGIPKDFNPRVQKIVVALWMFAVAAVCNISPVEFIFRYFRVVKNYTISYAFLALMSAAVLLVSAHLGACICMALESVEDHNATFGHLMKDSMWMPRDGTRTIFFGANIDNPFFRLFLATVTVNDALLVAIILFTSTRTLKTLAADESSMSRRTRYMQTQLNRLMFAEAISLTSVFVIPIAVAMSFLLLRVQWVGFGAVIAIFIQWVPAVNPMTTILLVGPYRRQIVKLFLRKKIAAVNDSEPQEQRPRIDRRRSTIYEVDTHKQEK